MKGAVVPVAVRQTAGADERVEPLEGQRVPIPELFPEVVDRTAVEPKEHRATDPAPRTSEHVGGPTCWAMDSYRRTGDQSS